MGGFLYRAVVAVRGAIPLIIGLLLAVLTFVPYGSPVLNVMLPSLTLPLVYYWTLNRPEVMPFFLAFLLGFWQDVLAGGPLGLNALLLVLMRGAAETQLPVFRTQSAIVVWLAFGIISLILALLGWLIASWWYWTWPDIAPFVVQWALGIIIYIPLMALFGWLDRLLFERR